MKRFTTSRSGSTTAEFAFIAPIILVTLLAGLELSFAGAQSYALRVGLTEAARGVRTGLVQTAPNPEEAFRDRLCGPVAATLDCARIDYDVRTFADFATMSPPPPVFDDQGRASNFTFAPGAAETIMAVRVAYRHQLLTPGLAALLDPSGQGLLFTATSVVRGEPWAG